MKNETIQIIGIIIIPVLIAVGFFNNPNIVLVRQPYSDYTCPESFYSYFEVNFKNTGTADTSLCVTLSSPDKNISFIKEKDCLYIENGESPTTFKFQINDSLIYKINNVSISYNYIYKKFFLNKNSTTSCFYVRENYGQSLKLKTQSSLN